MDFIDEYDDSRPRLLFQSRPQSSTPPSITSPFQSNKPLFIFSLFFSFIFLLSSYFFFNNSQTLQSLSIWVSISFLVGPFAPLSITCGDIRVGQGEIVNFPSQIDENEGDESKKKGVGKRIRGKRFDLDGVSSNGSFDFVKNSERFDFYGSKMGKNGGDNGGGGSEIDEGMRRNDVRFESSNMSHRSEVWSEEDLGMLRKQIGKNPVGKPRRWEVIAEAFKGKYSVESVISKGKSLGKEKPVDSDSYSKFLKDRKVVDKRVEGGDEGGSGGGGGGDVNVWSSSEDIALLNALKAFPKDVAMRWEKIAAAVPGKSKPACMKRVTELKKEFRSSKGSTES